MNLKEKYAGKSFAEIAETISKKYKNREIDPVQKRSFETEINALKDLQETYRLKESIKDKMKMAGGGMLSTALGAGKGIAEAFAGALTVPMKAVGGNIDDDELYGLTRSLSQLDIENYQKQQQEGQFGTLPKFTSPLTSTATEGTPEPELKKIIIPAFSNEPITDKEIKLSGQTPSTFGNENLPAPQFAAPLMNSTNTEETSVPEDMFGPKPLATNLERGMQTNLEVAEPEQFTKEELKQRQKNRDFYMKNPLDFDSDKLRASRFVVDEALAKMQSFKGNTEEGIEKPDGGMTGQESTLGASSPTFNNKAEETKEPSKIGEFLKSPYGALATGKGIEMLGKSAMLLGGYDRFSPNYNPFEQEALNLMRSQGIDTQAVENKILAQQEAAMAGIGNVRSTAVQQALQQGINVNTADALANAELQQQQMRNQLSTQMAGALNVAGQQRVQAEDTARALTAASKASYQQNVVNLLETIGATGEEISNFKTGQISDALSLNIMAKMYDFGYDVECVMKNLSTGNINGCFKANDNKSETAVPKPDLTVKGK